MTSLKDELQPYELRGEYMTFRREEHPFKQWDRYCSVKKSQQLEVFFPRDWFSLAASKFAHFNHDHTDTSRKIVDMLYIYCYLAEQAHVVINNDIEERSKPPRRSDSRASNTSGDEVADAAAQERKAQEDADRKARDDEDKQRGIISLMEVVPLASNPSKVAGYRKKLFINTDRVNPSQILSKLFNQNARIARNDNLVYNPRKHKGEKKHRIHSLQFSEYVALCEFYLATTFEKKHIHHPDLIAKHDNPLNPLNVFSMHNSLQIASRFNAHPHYTDYSRYIHGDSFSSPEGGKHMYWLRPEHDALDRVLLYMWPNVRKPEDYDPQKQLYLMNGRSDSDDDDNEVPLHERLAQVYELTCRNTTSLHDSHNLRSLGKRQTEKRQQLQLQLEGLDDEEYTKQLVEGMKQIMLGGLEEFKQIFSASGTVPKSLRAIAMFVERNFVNGAKMKWRKQTSNISRFGELMASLVATSESILKINTLQADLVACFLKVIHVYSGRPFHAHTLYTGAPKAGKSHIQRVLSKLLVDDTYNHFAYSSAKADASAGDERDFSIYFYEEIPASMLGVNKAGGGGKAAATAMTDQESFIKNILTSGRFNAKRTEKDDNGRFVSLDVEVYCNSVWVTATNEPLLSIPDAMASRFHVRNLQSTTRIDSGGLLGKTQENQNIRFKQAIEQVSGRYKRMQALVAVAFQMIYTGVLPQIEMSAAYIVLNEVMKQARDIGLPDTDDVRHYERVVFIIESCVVLEAIDTVFDSEVSPIPDGDKFDYEQMLLLAPYLRATIEQCVFALGLLRDQYENPVQRNVVTSLVNTFFQTGLNQELLMSDEGLDEIPLADDNESFDDRQTRLNILDNNYYICEYPVGGSVPVAAVAPPHIDTSSVIQPVGFGKPPRYPSAAPPMQQPGPGRPRAPRQHELDDRSLIRQLTQELYNKIQPRPQQDEIRTVLEKLTTQLIPESHNEHQGIPALYFRDGKMYFSRRVYKQLQNHNLRSVVKGVVSKCITEPRSMVYGSTLPDAPYALDILCVEPERDPSRQLYVEDPNYFNDDVARLSLNMCTQFNEDIEESRKLVFSTLPGYVINCDVDEDACQRHMINNGITLESLENMPSVVPVQQLEEVLSRCHNREGLVEYDPVRNAQRKNYKKRIQELGDSCRLDRITVKRTKSDAFRLRPRAPSIRIDTSSTDECTAPSPPRSRLNKEYQEMDQILDDFMDGVI